MNEVQTSSVTGERSADRSDSFIDDDADFVKLFVGQVGRLLIGHLCPAEKMGMISFNGFV